MDADETGERRRAGTRCAIVEDSPILRGALNAYLASEGIDVVAEVDGGGEVVEAIGAAGVALVILDARVPGPGGIEIARAIAEIRPDVTLVLYTSVADEALIGDSLAVGITGIALKGATPTNLLAVIDGALAGRVSIDRQLLPGWPDRPRP